MFNEHFRRMGATENIGLNTWALVYITAHYLVGFKIWALEHITAHLMRIMGLSLKPWEVHK